MIDEYGKSVKALLYERVTSPLLGAFTISWVAFNWRFLAVLFSDSDTDTIYHKLDYLRDNLSDPTDILWKPLGITVAILVIYPFLAAAGTITWEYGRHLKIRIRDHFDEKNSISAERARELKSLVIRLLEQQAASDELFNKTPRHPAMDTPSENGNGSDQPPRSAATQGYKDRQYTEINWRQEYGELSQRERFKKAMSELVKFYPSDVDSFEAKFPDEYKYLFAFQLFEAFQGNRPRNRVTAKGQYFIKLHVMKLE